MGSNLCILYICVSQMIIKVLKTPKYYKKVFKAELMSLYIVWDFLQEENQINEPVVLYSYILLFINYIQHMKGWKLSIYYCDNKISRGTCTR